MAKSIEVPFFDSEHVLYKGKYWDVILHRDNQSYLGRSIVFLKSRIIEDPLQISKAEAEELWDIILPALVHALKAAFRADRINYSHLANAEHFVHWHIIPRYEKDPIREFAGETFADEKVGKHYAPSQVKKLSKGQLDAILNELKRHFKISS